MGPGKPMHTARNQPACILAHDVGTTGSKTCLYRIGDRIEQAYAR